MSPLDVVATAVFNTFRSKLRTTLTILAIFIGAFTLTLTSAVGTGVSSYLDNQVAGFGATDVLLITKVTDESAVDDGPAKYEADEATVDSLIPQDGVAVPSGVLTAQDLAAIADTDGISDVNALVTVLPSYVEYNGNGKFELSINANSALNRADLAVGDQLTEVDQHNQVQLPSSYLENLGFANAKSAVGKTITLGINDYLGELHELEGTVVGVQNESLLGSGVRINQTFTDALYAVQKSGRPAATGVGYYSATAHFDRNASEEQVDRIQTNLNKQGYSALTVADQLGTIQTVIGGIIGVLNAFAVIALIAAAFGIINTLLMSVQERTREIGLMKAMGMSGGRVYALFSTEAVFIGFLGSALGALVAFGVGSVVSAVLSTTLLVDLEGLQVLQFAPTTVGSIILVVMLIAFFAGTIPARRAARQNPIDALRYE
ncbi:ABC transporter permease [Cryobacterium sp. TMT2-15-1]|uniref:ABC transporter permease n=1 Tax=Cryobacterium sp. TMT2-15-1 TaxID=1259246 RepID=UPI00106ACE34|nr:ABC transporter permease [Cryobacterium sp. TMT2-15-1]TFC55446.1 ABC transporter permease [Cryobacterium sp. TMT2-15-1]